MMNYGCGGSNEIYIKVEVDNFYWKFNFWITWDLLPPCHCLLTNGELMNTSHQKAHYTNTKYMMITLKNSDRGEVGDCCLDHLESCRCWWEYINVCIPVLSVSQSVTSLSGFLRKLAEISRHLKLLKILL